MKSKIQMCEGSLFKNILIFSLPLMLSNILQVLFNMADIAVIGQFAGSKALGEVGSTPMLIFLYTGFILGLGSGVNVITAYFIGANNQKDIDETVHTAAIVSFLTGLILMGIGLATAKPILALMKTKPVLLEGATVYFRIYMCGMPALALYNFGNAVLSATGDTKRPLYYLTAAGIINVILNLVFVVIFKMDVAGVAAASIISQYIAAFLIMQRLFRGSSMVRFSFENLCINSEKLSRILRIGLPSGCQFAIFAIANIFIQSAVNYFDPAIVAGNSAAANADPLMYDIMAAFYTAGSTFIGQNYGAGNKKRVLKSFYISMFYAFIISFILGILLFFFGEQFLCLFTRDPEVLSGGLQRLSIMALSYCVSAFMDAPIAASRGLGKTLVPSIIVIIGSCLFRILWVYTVFAYFHTIPSLFLLYIFSWAITAVAEMAYFIHIYRKILC